jgi:hypothetical protein
MVKKNLNHKPLTVRLTIILLTSLLLCTSCNKDKKAFIIGKIQSTAKLATTETVIDKVIIGTKELKFLRIVNLSSAEFVAYSKAYIKTGVDLNKLKKEDVEIDGESITLRLPHVQVLDFRYPFDEFEIDQDISDNDFLNRISIIDQEHFYREAELNIRENLEYTGIVKSTEDNTRRMMQGLLKNLGYKAVFIEFKEGDFMDQVPRELLNPDKES